MEEEGCSLRAASKQFGLDRKVLRSWMKNRDNLKSAISLYGPDKKKLHQGRPPKSQELDKQVLDYLLNLQSEGVNVCDQELQRKARECAVSLGLKDFKAAATWLKRWKQRCGVNEIMTETNPTYFKERQRDNMVNEACHLSHVMSGEPVKLVAHWNSVNPNRSCDVVDGPVHYDFSASEHNYCKGSSLLLDHTPSLSPSLDLNSADVTYRMLQCSNDQPYPMTSPVHPAVLAVFEVVPPSNDVVTMMFGDECIMGSLDLPLSHEEIVRDEDNDVITHQITVNQTTLHDVSFQCDLSSSVDSQPLTKTQTTFKSSTKSRTTRRRRGKGSSRTCRQATTRKIDKPSEVSLVQATLPNLMLDDPQGPSGLLASRMLQPVFPDEPEIVYLDM